MAITESMIWLYLLFDLLNLTRSCVSTTKRRRELKCSNGVIAEIKIAEDGYLAFDSSAHDPVLS
jgi:hypothetical protein